MQYNRTFPLMKQIVSLLIHEGPLVCKNAKILPLSTVSIIPCYSEVRTVHTSNNHYLPSVLKFQITDFLRKIISKFKLFDIEKSRALNIGYLMYENTVDKINYNKFYKDFNMSDTFFSWFLVTELHVWMVMLRCMAEGHYGKFARNALVEAMWNDVNVRSSRLGRINVSVKKKQIKELSYQFNAAVIGYDEGILSNDMVLAGALWQRFFYLECNNPEHLEKLIIYVRKQVHELYRVPPQKFLRSPVIKWLEY